MSGMTFDIAVDLDATSPLRNQADLKGVVDLLESNVTATNVITGTPAVAPLFHILTQIELDEFRRVHLSGKRQKLMGK